MTRRIATPPRLPEPPDFESDPRTPTLVLQIADQLIHQIITGKYAPGERIREQEIADGFGASRGPVREALRLCEQDGLVELLPWRGARVVNPDIDEVDDLFEVLSAIMGVVARLAATHAPAMGLAEFERVVVAMEKIVAERQDLGRQLALAFEAGAILRKHCGSKRAGQMLTRVGRLAYWEHRFMLDADLAWRRRSVAKYRKLVDALKQRNGASAEKHARALVLQSKTHVVDRMRRTLSSQARVVRGSMRDLPPLLRHSGKSDAI